MACIIQFGFVMSLVSIFTGSCHKDKWLVNGAAWVAMARILHLSSLFKYILAATLHDFIHLKHTFRNRIKITTSNNENSCINISNLYSLKVMWEIGLTSHFTTRHLLSSAIKYVEFLWVFFHYIYEKFIVCNLLSGLLLLTRHIYLSFCFSKVFNH